MSKTHDSNPFDALGLPMSFDLDAAAVERAYLGRLRSAHPDAGGADDAGGIDAAGLNRARVVLLDAEQRANRLLEALGGPAALACKDLPGGFLMEMMTRREEIEEQIAEGGSAARTNWESWAHDERTQYTESASVLFSELGEAPDSEKLTQVRVLLNAWRYIERLIEQLDPEYDPANADFR